MREARMVASNGTAFDGRLVSPLPATSPLRPDGRELGTDLTDLMQHAMDTAAPEAATVLRSASTPARPVARASEQSFDEDQISAFVEIVLGEDDSKVGAFVHELRAAGCSVESIYLDLLAPAAHALGERWTEDACDFVDVTLAMGRLQLVLRDLSHMFVRDRSDLELVGRVLLSCVPGEQHALGIFMVAEFFIRDGWGVRVGPPLSERDLLADVRSVWYDVIGFSVSCGSRLDHLKREIRKVREQSLNQGVLIMVGGRTFNDQPELVARVGADASAVNAELAPERARQLLALT
ncbi:MAG: cobalamin-dependent protein [bacterium]